MKTIAVLAAVLLGRFVLRAGPAFLAATTLLATGPAKLLNVSYDPTRGRYQNYNAAFAKYWKTKTGVDVEISQSHNGSAEQVHVCR